MFKCVFGKPKTKTCKMAYYSSLESSKLDVDLGVWLTLKWSTRLSLERR